MPCGTQHRLVVGEADNGPAEPLLAFQPEVVAACFAAWQTRYHERGRDGPSLSLLGAGAGREDLAWRLARPLAAGGRFIMRHLNEGRCWCSHSSS